MTALPHAVADSATMLRRNLRHAARYPAMTFGTLLLPIFILLLFVGILGDTLGAGLGAAQTPGGGYVDYVTPGIILLSVASGCTATAVSVSVDMTSGIVDRFRTMAISPAALLTGHVAGSTLLTLLSTAVVVLLAVLLGFRPSAGALDWLALAGLLVLVTLALTWTAVLMGLRAATPESASNTPLLLQLLPFLSSGFVPAESLPGGVRWFAENQPFTPITETVRGLLLGTPIGGSGPMAVAWCVAIALLAYAGARATSRRARAA